jgi:2-C-methyl-D-erythritol 2,4-cyclodiphosphate synthase
MSGKMKIGFGYDSHRFTENRPLILAGVNIPSEKGLAGHSDADVLVHAICDAMLGAMGAADIGCQFPDTDPLYKNISSLILLEKVYALMSMQGYVISNIDTTIILEAPKIRPFVKEMQKNLAQVLHLDRENINIKAKTNEGMGFIGKNEGIAAFAVVILEKV